MTEFISHFPSPAPTTELTPGDLFGVSYPNGFWIGVRVTVRDRNGALVLHSDDAREQTPFLVWTDSLPSTVEKVSGRVTVRPRGPSSAIPKSADSATPGSVSIVPGGDVFIRGAGRSGGRDYYSLTTGHTLSYLPDDALSYAEWEMVLEHEDGEGHKAKPFARFPAQKPPTGEA